MKSMMRVKEKLHHAEGIEMNNPRRMISDNHRKGLSKICIWNGNNISATFMAFNASMYTFVARTVESSAIRKSMMIMRSDYNNLQVMPVLGTKITRTKTGLFSKEMRSYPHRENFLLDYHFALAYSLILNQHSTNQTDFVFPEFEAQINYDMSEAKRGSQTAQLYRRCADRLIQVSKEYGDAVCTDDDEFNEEDLHCLVSLPPVVRGHANKKSSVNKLADVLDIQVFAFRCGWQVRNIHSAFDYIFSTTKKDAKCGKVLAGWLPNSAGEYLGGYPPNVEMIRHKKSDFIKFAEKLFFGDENTAKDVQVFLVCSLVFTMRT